jgi:plasmid stabilization system protein ParE
MKRNNVIILPVAWDDLCGIREYIAQNDLVTANRAVDAIIKAIRRLETFPLSAPLVPDEELSKEGYRVLVCGKYLCFYHIADKTAFVYHVAHGAKEYSVILKRLSSEDM